MPSSRTALVLSLVVLAFCPLSARAGFDMTYSGKGGEYNLPEYKVSGFSANVNTAPKPVTLPRPDNDPNAPALQVYGDRYVPDDVKKKYNLGDDWYSKSSPKESNTGAATGRPTLIVPKEEALTPFPGSAEVLLPPVDDMAKDEKTVVVSSPPIFVDSWRARKGENVRDVLRRWSERQKTDLFWASPSTPTLTRDFSYVGKFQDAVNLLVKDTTDQALHTQYRSEGLNPVMMSPASTVTSSLPAEEAADNGKGTAKDKKKMESSNSIDADQAAGGAAVPVVALPTVSSSQLVPRGGEGTAQSADSSAPVVASLPPSERTAGPVAPVASPAAPYSYQSVMNKGSETRWFGLAGAPLAEVLQVWSEDAGVQLIWQCERPFALKDTVSQVGLFEDAVFSALNQYNGEHLRPVGEMYKNPKNGQRVLVVRTDGSS